MSSPRATVIAGLAAAFACAFAAMLGIPSIALVCPPAHAHPLAPALLRVELGADGHRVTTRAPKTSRPPHIEAEGCRVEALDVGLEGDARVAHDLWRCGPDASVRLLADPSEPPLVLEVVSPDGVRTAVLDAAHPRASLSAPADGLAVFGQWLGLGVEHLATGLDHVLLVLGLCALIGFRARLIAALTAFTLGHSLSLALAATGLVTLPPAAVEVAIAATLVLLGLELATRPAAPGRARPGPLARWPWAGGVAIGLVHGLGFAAALRALGLPDAHVGGALVGFNLGLELAQLAFVAALGLAVLTARRLARGTTRWPIASAAGWLIGIAGAAWVLDRALP